MEDDKMLVVGNLIEDWQLGQAGCGQLAGPGLVVDKLMMGNLVKLLVGKLVLGNLRKLVWASQSQSSPSR